MTKSHHVVVFGQKENSVVRSQNTARLAVEEKLVYKEVINAN